MPDKTVEDVLDFVKTKWDEADDAGHWGEANAFKMIQEYIESHRTELTPEELSQMKPKKEIRAISKVDAHNIIETLPEGASPNYDMAKGYTVFYLTADGSLDFQVIGEPRSMFVCPLLPNIIVDELIKIRDSVWGSVVNGTIEGTHICDGGDQGRGLFFVTTNGTVIKYK